MFWSLDMGLMKVHNSDTRSEGRCDNERLNDPVTELLFTYLTADDVMVSRAMYLSRCAEIMPPSVVAR